MASRPKEKMPVSERAKQFAPFSALHGLQKALEQQEKILEPKKDLSDDAVEEIDTILRALTVGDTVTAVFYRDGEYVQLTGTVAEKDTEKRILRLGQTQICFDDIFFLRV